MQIGTNSLRVKARLLDLLRHFPPPFSLGGSGGKWRYKNTLPCRRWRSLRDVLVVFAYGEAAHQGLDAWSASLPQGEASHIVAPPAGRLRQPLATPPPGGLPWCHVLVM